MASLKIEITHLHNTKFQILIYEWKPLNLLILIHI
jgi:hypothetical protein